MSHNGNGEMRDADWTSLVYAVERGQCTLMLGPDAVTGSLDGQVLPVHVALAQFVKDRLGPSQADLDPYKPSSVAQAAVALEDPFTLQGWVKEFYDVFVEDPGVLDDLAALPFELVINTSPGLSVQRRFEQVKPRTVSDYYDCRARARPSLPDPAVDAPLVYQLYGSLEEPSSMVLSDNDRLDFIVSVVSDEPPLPPKLKSALRDPNRSFLFVGFDLAQWQFRVLLHVLTKDSPRRYKSFAFELVSASLDTEVRDFYRIGHKIHFVTGDIRQFGRDLRSRVTVAAPEDADVPGSDGDGLRPDAPLVFLCHASEDKAVAEQIAEQLERNGIQSWLDKDDLHAGDEWSEKITRAIQREVDYVAVLQSASMLRKDIAYVNREINLALDRQQEFRSNRRFILPVVLDDPDNRLVELDRWQSIDVSHSSGIDELIREIKRDQNKASRQL